MECKLYTNNYEETIKLGEKIGLMLNKGDVILLDGDLGAGKTTFTKGIGNALGVTRVINSPTFTIVKEYKGTSIKLNHLDLYRLEGINDDFDLEEYFNDESICVCEWPFQVSEILPDNYLMIYIKRIDDNKREFTVTGNGKYEKIVGELNV